MAVLSSCWAETVSVVPGRTSGCGCAMNGCRRSSPVVVCVGVGRVGLNTGAPPSVSVSLSLDDDDGGALHANVSVISSKSVATTNHNNQREQGRKKRRKRKEGERRPAIHMKEKELQKQRPIIVSCINFDTSLCICCYEEKNCFCYSAFNDDSLMSPQS